MTPRKCSMTNPDRNFPRPIRPSSVFHFGQFGNAGDIFNYLELVGFVLAILAIFICVCFFLLFPTSWSFFLGHIQLRATIHAAWDSSWGYPEQENFGSKAWNVVGLLMLEL